MTSALAEKKNGAYSAMQKRLRRAPVEIRVEIETKNGSIMAQARDFNPRGISMVCGTRIETGDNIKLLLYIPSGKEFELMRIGAEVVWCKEQQGIFTLGASFRGFAPGDERRYRAWILDQLKR
jgi:hypothetical protein